MDVTASTLGVLVKLQLLAVTLILPLTVPAVTVIEVVPCPAVMEYPEGTAHEYEVANGTAAIE